MSKTVIFFLAISLISSVGKAQTIQNAGFENWSNQFLYEDPDGYSSSNTVSIAALGQPNALKTTDAYSGSYAVSLETVPTSENPVKGAVYIGDIGEDNIWGGTPFTERADSVTGYVKYNVMPGDTAYVGVLFKKLGQPLGVCLATFLGTQNEYQYFSQPVQWFIPVVSPDTIVVAILSSALFGDAIVGSQLTVDNLSFVGTTGQFPNGDFENWTEYYSEEADNWISTNIFSKTIGFTPVIKTNDSYEGSLAVQLENMPTYFGDTLAGITNGHFSFDGPVGGMPVVQIPETFSGYYKYSPSSNSVAVAGIKLFRYNSAAGESELLAEDSIILSPAGSYTPFEINVQYNAYPPPDTVNVYFSVTNQYQEKSGGILVVDDLNMTFKPVGFEEASREMTARVFPNPTTNYLFVEAANIKEDINVSLVNVNGVEMLNNSFSQPDNHIIKIDISSLPSGIYFYILSAGEKQMRGKLVKR